MAPELGFSTLPAILRVLLCTDGTVTHSLAAYFDEPINVLCLRQESRPLSSVPTELDGEPGETVIEREVLLQGAASGRQYAHAWSTICVGALDRDSRAMLDSGAAGIGELLAARNLETCREIRRIGLRTTEALQHLEADASGGVVFRDYVIHSGGKAVILVTEEFPVALYTGA